MNKEVKREDFYVIKINNSTWIYNKINYFLIVRLWPDWL